LDDDFDTDFGYQGKLQFLLGVRDPQVADVSGSNGFESDNDGGGSTNAPRTSPTWWNVTLVGPKATGSTTVHADFKRGMHLRRSSQNKISNALLMGWPTGLYIDGANTVADAQSGAMYVKNSVLSGMGSNFASTDATFQGTMGTWFGTNGGRTYATNAEVLLADPFSLLNPNAMPTAGSPVLTGGATPPNDGFFDATATFVGAFGSVDWTAGWSTFNFQTDVEDVNPGKMPGRFTLAQNYPNPFNPSTNIQFELPAKSFVSLKVYNIQGQEMAVLIDEVKDAGVHTVDWNAANLQSGTYICQIKAGDAVFTKKMLLIK
jgi:hypothetical protein